MVCQLCELICTTGTYCNHTGSHWFITKQFLFVSIELFGVIDMDIVH